VARRSRSFRPGRGSLLRSRPTGLGTPAPDVRQRTRSEAALDDDAFDGRKTAIADVVRELTEFAIPVQERDFATVRETSPALAGEEDPLEES
jgi:hypothetical protein